MQAKARKMKEEMIKEKNLEKATEEYIESLHLINMYYSEELCLKGDPKHVTSFLKRKDVSNTAKLNTIKTNILIRSKGFGWDWSKHAWSKNRNKYLLRVLANHLRWIIRKEIKDKLKIPTEPNASVPERVETGVLGTETEMMKDLDQKYLEGVDSFKKRSRSLLRRREERGESSIYSMMQPFYRPALSSLIGRRIDVCESVDVAGGTALKWFQGQVLGVYDESAKPKVKVEWDAVDDVEGYEDKTESDAILMPSKWNPNNDCDGAWRMDVDIDLGEDEMEDCELLVKGSDDRESELDYGTDSSDESMSTDSNND